MSFRSSSLMQMKLPSIRTRLGADLNASISAPPGGAVAAAAAVPERNPSDMSLLSDFSGIGASGLSLGMLAEAANPSDRSMADAAAGPPSRVAVWDASDSASDLNAVMEKMGRARNMIRAARNPVMSYMAGAKAGGASDRAAAAAAGTETDLSVDCRREVFAMMKTKKEAGGVGPRLPVQTIMKPASSTGLAAGGGGGAAAVGGASASGGLVSTASGRSAMISIAESRASLHSGVSGVSSLSSGFMSKGTQSISAFSWQSKDLTAAAGGHASLSASTAFSPEGGAGTAVETINEVGGHSRRSDGSFSMAVDSVVGLESGRSVLSNFSRMSLISDFDDSSGFSSKDFSSAATFSSAGRGPMAGGQGGSISSRGGGGGARGSLEQHGTRTGLGTIRGSMEGYASDEEYDDYDGVS